MSIAQQNQTAGGAQGMAAPAGAQASAAANTAAKRPVQFEDMMKLKRIGDFTVSPDGKWVTFTAVDVDLASNKRKPHLWIVPVAGGESKRLTTEGGAGEDRLRFAPDGKTVLFVTARDGGSQVWTQDFDGASGALTG